MAWYEKLQEELSEVRDALIRAADWAWDFAWAHPLPVLLTPLAFVLMRWVWFNLTAGMQSGVRRRLEQTGEKKSATLLVIAPGFNGQPRMRDVAALGAVALNKPDVLWLAYGMPVIPALNWLMNGDPARVAANMDRIIGQTMKDGGYSKIVLLGYSAGALLLRKAFIFNHPEFGPDHPEEQKLKEQGFTEGRSNARDPTFAGKDNIGIYAPIEWHGAVARMVLMAGLNGGWSRADRRVLGVIPLAAVIAVAQFLGVSEFVRALERGHPFVENLRIEWMRLADRGADPKLSVQLVGVQDQLVDAQSEMDLSATKDFFYITLPGWGHRTFIDVHPCAAEGPPMARPEHPRALLAHGLCFALESELDPTTNHLKTTNPALYTPDDLTWVSDMIGRVSGRGVEEGVKRVVIVLHGIRDNAHWADKFRLVIEGSLGEQAVAVVAPTFGRFPLTDFLLGRRDEPVRWFAREYSELLARYPNLKDVSVIGHSYGTWVIAKTLERYRAVKLDKIFLAGSVLPRSYKWSRLVLKEKRLNAIANAPADGDWVVGIFPAAYDVLRKFLMPLIFFWRPLGYFLSLGDAGLKGFSDPVAVENQLPHLTGGHGAFKKELSYLQIAGVFAVQGASPRFLAQRAALKPIAPGPRPLVRVLNFASLPVFASLLALLATVIVVIGIGAYQLPTLAAAALLAAAAGWQIFAFLKWL